jgi:cytochrome bd-type quinol oxidase subunit 2
MPDNDNVAYASIIIGIIIIIYPYLGQETLSKISGLILMGLFFLIFFSEFKENSLNVHNTRNKNILWLLVAILALLFGVSLMLQMFLYVFISQIWLLIVGILLGVSGALIFYSDNNNELQNNLKFILIVLGLVYIFMGLGIFNPMYLGIVIGLAMISYGYLSINNS